MELEGFTGGRRCCCLSLALTLRSWPDAYFACYVRNVTPTATKLTVPLGAVECEPAMSDEKYSKIFDRSRAIVAEPLEPSAPPAAPPAPQLSAAPQSEIDPSTPSEW